MDLGALKLVVGDGVVRIEVHAKPRARTSRVHGLRGDALDVSVAAPPVDGAANEELVETLAKALGIAKSFIVIARGGGSRTKLVLVRGLTADDVRARLASACDR